MKGKDGGKDCNTCSSWLARVRTPWTHLGDSPALGFTTMEVVNGLGSCDARAPVTLPWKARLRLLRSLVPIPREPRGAQGSGGWTWGFSTGNHSGERHANLKQKSPARE